MNVKVNWKELASYGPCGNLCGVGIPVGFRLIFER